MNKKVLVSDYDKTFYLDEIDDMENNKKEIKKFRKNGNIFVIATGRSYKSLKGEIDLYSIEYDYLILDHGSLVIDKNNNILFNHLLDNELVNRITNDLNNLGFTNIYYSNGLKETLDVNKDRISKITGSLKDIDKFNKAFEFLRKKYSNETNMYLTSRLDIEIITNKTNKSKALDLLMKKANFKKENIYTIGDNFTDIEMISDFNGSCMERSIDKLLNMNINKYDSVSTLIRELNN